ncbi:MAG: SufD family Fe-S cluster assembly protein, partial [Gaiellaceae bacterium]
MARAEILERYRELPLPTTRDEHWRFTDLAGFDPDAWTANGVTGTAAPPSMLELDVAGVAVVGEGGIEIERTPEGIRFEQLPEDHELLYSLVGWDEKFAAHNAAMWTSGLLVHVPRGVVLEKPLYVRIANAVEGGSLFWRLLIVADPESRFTLVEEYSSANPELAGYSNAAVEIVVSDGAKVEYVSVQNYSRSTWHFASHHARVERDAELDWVAGGFGSAKGKVRIQNDLAGAGATSRVTGAYFADGTQHLDYDTFQEHIAPSTTSDFAFKGALRDTARAVWRGMIRVEEGAQKTNA